MNALQTKMLEMLCELDDICRKHGIEYCIFAGSGLGADRHGGFIPWDDDADIVMTLDNYEKLLQVFNSEAKEGRTINCLEWNHNYPFTYARYVDTTTTAIQRHTAFGSCDPGIKIDIFVVVPTDDNLEQAEQHRLEILAFAEAVNPHAIMHFQRPEGFYEKYLIEKELYDKLGREEYISKRMPELKYYREKGTGRYVLFAGMMSNSYLIDADIMDEVVYVKYENTELPISKHNVKFSKLLYGESWISKPKDVETPHHTFLLDSERPYDGYLEMLWQECDYDEIEQLAAQRRYLHTYEREEFRDVLINNQQLRNLAVEMNANAAYTNLPEELRTDWRYIYNLFTGYYSAQLKGNNKHYKLFITLDEAAFEAAINGAVMTDKYYEAADIISIGLDSGALTVKDSTLDILKYRIDVCRAVTETLYIHKDFEQLKMILTAITDELVKDSLTVKIAALWLESVEQGNFTEICNRADMLSSESGEPGEVLAIKGYCLEKNGQTADAEYTYMKAAANVRNGYLFQWLADKGYSTYEYSYE